MTKSIIKYLIFFLFSVGSLAFTQELTNVKGFVTDKESGEPLLGANVYLHGTVLGGATDTDGFYYIRNVPAGTYIIKVVYIGYQEFSTELVVPGDKDISKSFELDYGVIVEGKAVEITAQAEGQLAAINQQLASKTIVNVVSRDRIQELPDANAAEAISRLPGTSIVRNSGEGTKVVVRGLEPRFNNITINGIAVPSLDANDRSVDLSLVSPDVLDGVSLTKAITPQMDADAVGGSIDLQLKKARGGFAAKYTYKHGYNSQQNSYTPFKTTVNLSNRLFNEKLGFVFQGIYDKADRGSDRLAASYRFINSERAPGEEYRPNQISDVTLTDRSETRNKYGGSLLLDYALMNGHIQFNNIYSRQERHIVSRRNRYDVDLNNSFFHTLVDQDINTGLYIGSLSGAFDFDFIKSDFNLAYARASRDMPRQYESRFKASSSFEVNDPNELRSGPQGIPLLIDLDPDNVNLDRITLEKEKSTEEDLTLKLDFTAPISLSTYFDLTFKFGGKLKSKDRTNDASQWQSALHFNTPTLLAIKEAFPDAPLSSEGVTLASLYFLENNYSAGTFLGGNYEMPFAADASLMRNVINSVEPFIWPRRNIDSEDYTTTEKISSGYFMSEINIGPKLMVMAGARFEHEETTYQAFTTDIQTNTGDGTETGEITEKNSRRTFETWFPQFHLRYKISDWLSMRLAKTRSLARPNFNFLSPGERISHTNLTFRRGTPNLKPAISENIDASVSAYESKFGLFTVSGFYKEIDDFFYVYSRRIINAADAANNNLDPDVYAGYTLTDYINSPNEVTMKGLEFDFQTQLQSLTSIFKGILFNINYSLISSKTKYEYTLLKTETVPRPPFIVFTRVDTARTGRMLRQSDDILNIAVGYDRGGFSGRASAYFQGNTFSSFAGANNENDGFTDDLLRWDLQLSQKISGHIKLFFNMNNLTNERDRQFEPVANFDRNLEFYGLTADFGIQLTY